ncbi:MAG TPA: glutaredoxin domain-containing protein [Xanthomonadaceae bacterium]
MFDGIGVDMSEEELALSRSTPGARFDAPPSPAPGAPTAPPPAPVAEPEVTAEIADFVERVLHDAEQPVVLFALEWCEFCWSVRKLFARAGIPYRSVDLDSAAYQRDDPGGRIRAALRARTGLRTIPQVFVGERLVGGCTETFDAFRDGSLQRTLKQHGVDFDESTAIDPYTLLPGWLQKRK